MNKTLITIIGLLFFVGSYANNISDIINCAKQGDVKCQCQVGQYYSDLYRKNKKDKDGKKAVEWYLKAANQGDGYAQYKLAMCYSVNYGRALPFEECKKLYVQWILTAIEQDIDSALYQAGCMYENGYYVTQDYQAAIGYFNKAASLGHLDSKYELALCYEKGKGVDKDEAKAIQMYIEVLNHDKDHADALNQLGMMYIDGRGVEKNEEEGVTMLYRAVEHGNQRAEINLGICFEQGWGVPQDYNLAMAYYNSLMQKNSYFARMLLIDHYVQLTKPSQNLFCINIDSVLPKAQAGDPEAQTELGIAYFHGEMGIRRNLEKGMYWFNQAIAQNYVPALYKAGHWYCTTFLDKREDANKQLYEEGLRFYQQAVGLDSVEAPLYYGCHFTRGFRSLVHYEVNEKEENVEECIKWLKIASKNGNAEADYELYWQTNDKQYLQQSANRGYARAQLDLAEKAFSSNNNAEGWYWMKKALDQDYKAAYRSLFEAYAKGKLGFQKDMNKAMSVAYEVLQKDWGAFFAATIGDIYDNQDEDKNYDWAKVWYNVALKQGYAYAEICLSMVRLNQTAEELEANYQRFSERMNVARSILTEITNTTISTINTINSVQNNSTSSSTSTSSNTATSSTKSNKNGVSLQEDRKVYYHWEDIVRKMGTGLTNYDSSTLDRAQSAMRQIRTKWEAQGQQMYHSSWEDWK